MPYSKPISYNSKTYVIFEFRIYGITLGAVPYLDFTAGQQPTYFLVQIGTGAPSIPLVVARFAAGDAQSLNLYSVSIGTTANITAISQSAVIFTASVAVNAVAASINGAGFANNFFSAFGILGTFAYTLDFNGPDVWQSVNAGQLSIMNGGVLTGFDGQSATELGFHLAPEIVSAVNSSGGSLAAGVYSIIAILQWTDAQGNLHQSQPSVSTSVTVTDSQKITLNVTTPFLSQKSNVSIQLFATLPGGSIYYQSTDPTVLNIANQSIGNVITLVIGTGNNQPELGNAQPYTFPGSIVLENTAAAPATRLVARTNRLWYLNDESQNEWWYTKSYNPGNGIAPCSSLLNQVDPKLGTITAGAEMDGNLISLMYAGIFAQAGDGADDTGSNSTLSSPQNIPSDVGCDQSKSVIVTPNGILFHSPNGIYQLSRALQTSYVGMDVEKYNGQTITSALKVPGTSQIRFLCASNQCLMYDYIFGMWSIFTNPTTQFAGQTATIWNNLYTYVNATSVFQEVVPTLAAPTPNYTDNTAAFQLLLQTSYLAFSSIQAFQRVRRFITLGDFANGSSTAHGVQVQCAYDFSTVFGAAVQYFFGGGNVSGPFQYRERMGPNPAGTIPCAEMLAPFLLRSPR